MVVVRVLGPIDVVVDGEATTLAAPAHERILALLVAVGEGGISLEAMAEELWEDEDRPEDSSRTLRSYFSRMRPIVGHDALQISRGRGALRGVEIDAAEFEELVARARRAGDSPTAQELWSEAVGLWRGEVFGGYGDLASVAPVAGRLEELRAEALESWFAARLAAGEIRELAGDLDAAVAEFPLREGFRAQQLTALSGAGRRVEALRAFQQFRAELTDVGLKPSEKIAALDRRIAAGEHIEGSPVRRLRAYELHERLGEGAFSVVYRAEQPSVDRDVAVKQIRAELANRPEFVRQFEAEAHLVARLEHPFIVPLYDYWREPGSAYLVMRYLRGGSLAGRLLRGPMPLAEVVDAATSVADALDAGHRVGVIHRDVKPANILLDEEGRAYLGDFGIAVEEAEAANPEAWLSNGSPAYASPEQLRREVVGPAADVHGLGISIFEALTGHVPFPDETSMASLLDRQLNDPIPLVRTINHDIPAAVDSVLQRATAKDPVNRYANAGDLAASLAAAAGLDHQPPSVEVEHRNPYKGLLAFDEADAMDFAGRDRLVDELLETVAEYRVTTVVGPSGSGKSSVVRAGLVPAIRQNRISGSGQWWITTMVPGAKPYDDLAAAILRVATTVPAELTDRLRRDERGLARVVADLVPDDRELLLVIDQFEELFTLSDDEDRRRLLASLIQATTVEGARLRLVLTLRADFYDQPLRYPDFARLIRDATVPIYPLAADELERAITEPALAVGAGYEPGLVAQITADVADQPGALPLLQYTLTELYDQRADRTLTWETYERLGRLRGSIARRADALYGDSTADEQLAIRSVFSRLVNVGDGTDDTRRRVLRSELGSDMATATVIERYGAARLLTFDHEPESREQTVEVAHEALINHWPRLRAWLDDDRDDLRVLRHLTTSVAEWVTAGRPDSDLYRGGSAGNGRELARSTSTGGDDRREGVR